jgi:hypothetical protein
MPNSAAMAVLPSPSAAANTIRERIANPFADVVRRAHPCNWARSPSDNTTTAAGRCWSSAF